MAKPVILCVDDEKIILTSLKEQLRRHFHSDYTVEIVESGEEALEVVDELVEDRVDLPVVISDHIMPGMKGDELLREIHCRLPKTLKIMLTGQANAEAVGSAVNSAKLYRYIAKPWEEADLTMTVTEALRSYFQDKKLEEQNTQLQTMNQELERLNLELKNYNQTLELKVQDRTRALYDTLQKVEEANNNILESIQYAKAIQGSFLPDLTHIKQHLPESFFCWMPRDIVGGDLYFAEVIDRVCLLGVIDCTGHGVPGAFMTIVTSAGLRKIVKDESCYRPGEILQRLNDFVKTSLRQHTEDALSDDGLDAAICLLDVKEGQLIFAGANLPLYYYHQNDIHVIKGDRQSLGYKRSDLSFAFTNHAITLEPDMEFYLSSDGFLDQLGGERGRRFGTKHFKQLLLEHHAESFENQHEGFLNTFHLYRGDNEQQDDVTIVGFRP